MNGATNPAAKAAELAIDHFADLESDDIFSAQVNIAPAVTLFKETCHRCGGSGVYRAPSSLGTKCFGCDGKGYNEFKTSPEHRKAAKAKAAARKEKAAAAKRARIAADVAAFKAANPEISAWLSANAERFEFAGSLNGSLHTWGNLTAGQIAAVRNCIAKDAQRKIDDAARAKAAPSVDIGKIEQVFALAMSNGLKSPKLRLDAFRFSPAKPTGNNPGAIYVVDASTSDYLGKIAGGRLLTVRGVDQATQDRIAKAAANPAESAVAYGRLTGCCAICSRELENAESVARGIGPICAEKYGF